MVGARTLNDIFYPPKITTTSSFNTAALENVTLELKPQYTNVLPKFTGLQDAYLFLREFEDVCSMTCYPNVPVDIVRLEFIFLL